MLRALLLCLLIGFSLRAWAGSTEALPVGERPWISASSLKNARKANEADRATVTKQLASKQMHYNFAEAGFLIHEGDLVIDGNFDCDTRLLVRGNLTVKGFYNDYGDGIGVLVVDGTMSAKHLYSWGALYIKRDLNVEGLAMAVYNDFTFEVDGKVNARALVISDKFNDFKAGRIEVLITDDSGMEDAVRTFVPEVFTQPDHFELAFDDDFYGLSFDEGESLRRINQDLPLFRTNPATQNLYQSVQRATQSDLSDAQLGELIHQDRLLAQIISARSNLSDTLAKTLIELRDPTINAWLAGSKPELVRTQSTSMSPQLAESLANNPNASLATITELGMHQDAAVRVKVASFQALPDTEAGRALIKKLINDPDANVRAAMLNAFGYAASFGLELDQADVQARVRDENAEVRRAALQLPLNGEQTRELLGNLAPNVHQEFARVLRQQAQQRIPTRLSRAEITAFAVALIEKNAATHEQSAINTEAFLALPAEQQASRLPSLLSSKSIDLNEIARNTMSQTVMRQIARFALEHIQMIPDTLAENPFLPEDLQLEIVKLAGAAKVKAENDYSDHPMDALEALLGNEGAADSVLLQAVDLAIKRGINPADGGFQNALFHNSRLPQAALAKLDRKLAGDEDWALTLLLQQHATVEQRVRAMKRWYDDDADLQKSLQGAEMLSEAELYQRAAQSASKELQALALQNARLPLASVKQLQDSAYEDIQTMARLHPQIPLRELNLAAIKTDSELGFVVRNEPKDWLTLSKTLRSTYLRAAAFRRYGELQQQAQP